MKPVTNITRTAFGTTGVCEGKAVQFCYATRLWFCLDGSGYVYGARSETH